MSSIQTPEVISRIPRPELPGEGELGQLHSLAGLGIVIAEHAFVAAADRLDQPIQNVFAVRHQRSARAVHLGSGRVDPPFTVQIPDRDVAVVIVVPHRHRVFLEAIERLLMRQLAGLDLLLQLLGQVVGEFDDPPQLRNAILNHLGVHHRGRDADRGNQRERGQRQHDHQLGADFDLVDEIHRWPGARGWLGRQLSVDLSKIRLINFAQ